MTNPAEKIRKKELQKFKSDEPYIVMEGERWFMYYGHPRTSPLKLDVTAAVMLGLRIGTGQFDKIESKPVLL